VTLALVALWSCAEAILLFVVVDVPLSVIAVRSGGRRAAAAAAVAALAAVPGGLVMWLWAADDPAGARVALLALPAIDDSLILETARRHAESGLAAAFAGSFSGVPYKVYAWAAGSQHAALWPFLLMTPLLRLPRFLLVIALVTGVNRALVSRWSMRARMQVLCACWVAFYAAYFASM
jgi:membrane protein YqaA with SNARE-associated domain